MPFRAMRPVERGLCLAGPMPAWLLLSFVLSAVFMAFLSESPKGMPEGGRSLQASVARALAALPEFSPD
eukprot:3464625-Pyramimonas_sp.AAC.1